VVKVVEGEQGVVVGGWGVVAGVLVGQLGIVVSAVLGT